MAGKKKSTKEFIEDAVKVHGNKYDYSKVEYINNRTKVCIICPEHGEFWQTPVHHLYRKQGCHLCTGGVNLTTKEFIEKAKQVHGDKYDYSKVEYINNHTKVCIICPKHGEFWQTPNSHLNGNGCFDCSYIERGLKRKSSTKEFLEKAIKIHGDKYDYSKVEYVNAKTKVCIICPEHGEFWQTPNCHLNGQGCPNCNQSKMENEISLLLKQNNIKFEQQKRFKWLGRQSLDFYLPDYNIVIECQGKQHFESRDRFGGINGLNERLEKDNRKKCVCEKNNVRMVYYANYKYVFPYKVFNDKNSLLNEIITQ